MSIQNSTTGEILHSYTIDELKQQATLMRGYDLAALCAATSGHAGGTLSIMDITAALYLRVANHDPSSQLPSTIPKIPTGLTATASSGRRATRRPASILG